MSDDPSIREWDQQPGETKQWYARFLTYLNIPLPRSLFKAYQACGRGNAKSASTPSIQWRDEAKARDWKGRAAAYDAFVQEERRAHFKATADEVWDELHGKAVKAAKVLVNYATDRKALGKDPRQDRIRLAAAESVLDRLGFAKRPARPMFAEHVEDVDKPLLIELTGLTPEALEALAAYDDEDES